MSFVSVIQCSYLFMFVLIVVHVFQVHDDDTYTVSFYLWPTRKDERATFTKQVITPRQNRQDILSILQPPVEKKVSSSRKTLIFEELRHIFMGMKM